MRVTIKGLTDSTITFNTLGIIIRGNSFKPELYPNSIAKHIDIKTDEQMRELISLKNAKYVSFFDESETASISTLNATVVPNKPVIQVPNTSKTVWKNPVKIIPAAEETNIVNNDDIEDMPSKKVVEDEGEELLTVETKKNKGGRPRKDAKKASKIKAKPIKKSSSISKPQASGMEPDSKIVVMTPNGAIEGHAVNNMAGEMPEGESTRASIEALRQMENEEAEPESLVDESKLKQEEQMGGTVVIATGENGIVKGKMKNSLLPEADAIKKRGIKFIDPNGDDAPLSTKDTSKDAFIDGNDSVDSDGDDSDDSFIEI